ncbi:MAG: LptF/LptG family permease, partial [Calditrichales bacterium]|nr:LptF/LptG family permease [Calditrichales bacterium]
MIKILDIYLSKRFLINLLIAVLTWIVIFLVVDVIENISKFIDRGATIQQFLLYYLYYIPYIISLTLPIAMLLSSLFTLNSFAQNNEIIIQYSSGISLYRLLFPLFILAIIISSFAGVFNELIVPEANQRRLDMMRYDISKKQRESNKSRSNIYIQDTAKRKFVIKYFNGKTNTARNVSIQTFDGAVLVERIDAEKMIWENDRWLLKNGRMRKLTGETEELTAFKDSVLNETRIKPENLIVLQKKPEEMSYSELNYFIGELQAIGADAKKWLVERHLKLAMPFANFIVVLLGAPIASRKRRGGMGLSFGLSLLVSFVYFIIIRTGQVFGH